MPARSSNEHQIPSIGQSLSEKCLHGSWKSYSILFLQFFSWPSHNGHIIFQRQVGTLSSEFPCRISVCCESDLEFSMYDFLPLSHILNQDVSNLTGRDLSILLYSGTTFKEDWRLENTLLLSLSLDTLNWNSHTS